MRAGEPSDGGDPHAPFLRRLRSTGRDPRAFRGRRARAYLAAGLLGLLALAALAARAPHHADAVVRVANLASLTFLLATVGLWFGMRGRAFPVAAALVAALYGATGWAGFAFAMPDIAPISLLVGFGLFALAGAYLVLVLEEVVFDTHRVLRLRRRAWRAIPTITFLCLTVGLVAWSLAGGPRLPATSATALCATILLSCWWFLRAFNEVRGENLVLRELHLLAVSALVAALLADGLRLVRGMGGLVPGLLGYGILLGTWVYVSYTTLQRTQFLLPARDPVAWLSLLLAASFAILAHTQVLYRAEGAHALERLVSLRIHYLIAGVWIGITLLALRGLLRAGRLLGPAARGEAARSLAGGASKVAAGIVATEAALGDAALAIYRNVEHALPGRHLDPVRPRYGRGWELEEGGIRSLREEE
ncbi:MAG TPA: hypothetical protein VFH47_01090 [Candidatus Thermoplasmatota archaeon]|nr:hypothetical protein [Candidatus Thermoplasmatota archaeon]